MGSLTTRNDDGLVVAIRDQAMTDSRKVAEFFGKRHDTVLRAIRNMECSEEFNRRNFAPVNYTDAKGEQRPMYMISKSGFTMLAMGFTGKAAAEFKEKYIEAFEKMEKIIQQRGNAAWIEQRSAGKVARRELTDVIQDFVEYAASQGSKNSHHYYSNITKMTYKALSLVGQASPQPFRDMLEIMEQSCLIICEGICRNSIQDGMRQGMFYKDIYKLAKDQVETLTGTLRQQRLIA